MRRGLTELGEYKLTATAGAILFGLSVYALALQLEGASWTVIFRAQSSSVIFFSLVYLGVGILLARRGAPDVETFSISLCTTLSAIWTYELVYHYSFIAYLNNLKFPFFDFNDTSTLLLTGAASLLVLAGYKYIRVRGNLFFEILILAFWAVYVTWLLIGFPQFDGTFHLPRYIQVDDPVFVGYLLNRFSKLILCFAWVALYMKPIREKSYIP